MADLDRVVGGLRCRDVLGLLADFVDGELDERTSAAVSEHLQGCDACEKFGGEYGALVSQLRSMQTDPSPDPAVRAGLAARMRRIWSEEDAASGH